MGRGISVYLPIYGRKVGIFYVNVGKYTKVCPLPVLNGAINVIITYQLAGIYIFSMDPIMETL